MEKKKSFWPYGILLSIFGIVLACIATIIFASFYPVYEDNFYFTRYQEVKYDYSDIQKKQKAFEKEFSISANFGILRYDEISRQYWEIKENEKELEFLLKSLEKADPTRLDIKVELSRPHTNAWDQKLKISKLRPKDGQYSFTIKLPTLEKGRWQIHLKAENNEEQIAFYSYNLELR